MRHLHRGRRTLPVFGLLAVVITVQSFLIRQDRETDQLSLPRLTLTSTFVTGRGPVQALAAVSNGSPMPSLSLGARTMPPVELIQTPGADPASAAQVTDDGTEPDVNVPGESEAEAPPGGPTTAPPTSAFSLVPTGPAAGAAARSAASSEGTTVEVDVGDSLWTIAHRFHVEASEMAKLNGLDEHTPLRPGQVLVLPAGALLKNPRPGHAYYVTRRTESAIDIATRLGVPLISLIRQNDIVDLYAVPAGMRLTYPRVDSPQADRPSRAATPTPKPKRVAAASRPRSLGFLNPVRGRVSDGFGWRIHPVHRDSRFHTGVDLKADYGQVIKVAREGRVIFAGWLNGYGQCVVVRHEDGYSTRYAHCSQLLVKRGDKVSRSDKIARVGSTGVSTGPHCHFEVRRYGKPLDPLKFMARS